MGAWMAGAGDGLSHDKHGLGASRGAQVPSCPTYQCTLLAPTCHPLCRNPAGHRPKAVACPTLRVQAPALRAHQHQHQHQQHQQHQHQQQEQQEQQHPRLGVCASAARPTSCQTWRRRMRPRVRQGLGTTQTLCRATRCAAPATAWGPVPLRPCSLGACDALPGACAAPATAWGPVPHRPCDSMGACAAPPLGQHGGLCRTAPGTAWGPVPHRPWDSIWACAAPPLGQHGGLCRAARRATPAAVWGPVAEAGRGARQHLCAVALHGP